ncbi:Ring canal kelch like protein [Cyphomyrmex costatus]|uniref:Ring canal kelch like protein n=1 Tax=Cyphomyrmex costatus TaxID=456900 RepID=A0A195CCI6_9HYME|nr:Ring canal kelch like protein [Cyphomyrmex costatus]
MRKKNLLCDVTLIADGGMEVPAHKMVLAACSPYFYAMFTSFEERDQQRITLQGVDYSALELLVDYVYSAEVHVTEDNVQVLLPAANLLQLTDVRDACCDFLQAQLHPSNCLGIRAFADLHGCLELLTHADSYIEQHFSEVVDAEEFLTLAPEQVAKLICSDRLMVPSEEKVFECVISWVHHDLEKRQNDLALLMEHVRLPLLSQEYLVQRVEEEPLLKANLQCKDFLIEALKYHLLKGEQKSLFKTPRTKPRQPRGLPKVLLVVGGQAPKAIRSVECYDFKEERWYQVSELPTRRCRAGLCVLGGRVYAVGGFNGSLRVRTVDIYDAAADQWSPCPEMEARRSTLGVAVLGNCVYAVGGFDGSTGLNSAEVYDPRTREWRPVARMSTRRSSVGVGVVKGLLYAVGGYDGESRQCLSSVECYNPEKDQWKPVPEMSARRSGAGVGVLDGILYAVGGHDGPLVRKSVEAFNPETNQWTPVSDMALCRRNADVRVVLDILSSFFTLIFSCELDIKLYRTGVVALNGLLYVVGGDDGSSSLASVEMYSPRTDTWTTLPTCMGVGRSYAEQNMDPDVEISDSSREAGPSGVQNRGTSHNCPGPRCVCQRYENGELAAVIMNQGRSNQEREDGYQNVGHISRAFQNRPNSTLQIHPNLNPNYQNPIDLIRNYNRRLQQPQQQQQQEPEENIYERLDNDDDEDDDENYSRLNSNIYQSSLNRLGRNCFSTENIAYASTKRSHPIVHNCTCPYCRNMDARYICHHCYYLYNRLRYQDTANSRHYVYQVSRNCRCPFCRGEYSYTKFSALRAAELLKIECHCRNPTNCICRSKASSDFNSTIFGRYMDWINRTGQSVNNPLYAMVHVGRMDRASVSGHGNTSNSRNPPNDPGPSTSGNATSSARFNESSSSSVLRSVFAPGASTSSAPICSISRYVEHQHTCDDSCIRSQSGSLTGICQFLGRCERTECNHGRLSVHWWFVNKWLPLWNSHNLDRNVDGAPSVDEVSREQRESDSDDS